jgi:hypothetical protein
MNEMTTKMDTGKEAKERAKRQTNIDVKEGRGEKYRNKLIEISYISGLC